MSAALKVRKTLRAIAWIVVAFGAFVFLSGWSSYRNDLEAFECAHAMLDSASLDKLFAHGYVVDGDWDKWDEWAASHDATISWGAVGGGFAPSGIILEPGGIRADELRVRGCIGSLSRERYALRPNIPEDAKAEFGAGAVACGLVALGVLRWWFKRKPSAVT
jgi:hypothetical protein